MPFERVSVNDAGVSANNDVQNVSISADGRYIVYETSANNLVTGDSNTKKDIYLYDRQLDRVELISAGINGAVSNGTSTDAVVSADGRFVAFQSDASNLVAGDAIAPGHSSLGTDIFLYDRQTGSMSRVSGNLGGVEGNHSSTAPSISDDGRYVAFESLASDLVAGDTNGVKDVFVWDRVTGATTRVSVTSTGAQGSFTSDSADISGDGSHIAFRSSSTLTPNDVGDPGNGGADVFVYNRATGALELIGDRGGSPSLSSDGSIIAFTSNQQLTTEVSASPGLRQVFVYDRNSDAMVLASFSTTGTQSNNSNVKPDVSANGRYVVFESEANNIDPFDLSITNDVYLYDRVLDMVTAFTLSALTNESYAPSISSDGTLIAFHSETNFTGAAFAGTQAFVGYNGVSNQPASVSLSNVLASLTENASTASATKIADINTTDDGNGFNTVSLTGRDSASFSIIGGALYLNAGVTLDHETLSELQVSVTIDDAAITGAPDASAAIALQISDVNEAPTAVTLANTAVSLAENTATTTRLKVADIAVTDDALGTNVLGLTGADAGFFEIDGSELFLKAGTALNFEAKTSYSVAVTVNDPDVGPSPDATSATYTLNVTNVNEAPTNITLSNSHILEHAAVGTVVGTLSAIDSDVGDTFTYSLVSPSNFRFTIVGNEVRVARFDLDYEFFDFHTINVRATDGSGLTFQKTFNIAIDDMTPDIAIGDDEDSMVAGGEGNDVLRGMGGFDMLLGSGGDDYLDGGSDVDQMEGNTGNDTYIVDHFDDVTMENNATAAGGVDIVFSNVTRLLGLNIENLTLTGAAAISGAGNALANILNGNGAANRLDGKAGDDRIVGGGGNDTLVGGSGNDTLHGGDGSDVYDVDSTGDVVSETNAASSGGIDTVISRVTRSLSVNVENLTLIGNVAANGSGNALANALTGNHASNTLLGGAGNDTITGGAGRDIMTGGTGADDFDFNAITETGKTSTTRDVITDFAAGSDDIDLSTIDANGGAAGNTAFKFLSAKGAVFSGFQGELRWYQASGKTIIEGDVNGDRRADFHIELIGLKSLTAGDIIL